MATAAGAGFVVVASLAGWAEIQRRRFANYLDLATKFNAFQVVDVTEGWDDPRTLAQDTLAAVRQIVSDRWGFRGVSILWFDDEPNLSSGAKQMFLDGMRGVGVSIQAENDIRVAKKLIRENFDVVIANYGSSKERFAYQVPSEIAKHGLDTPVVIYGLDSNPSFAKEARCYGAVARATTIDTLFSAVVRALAANTRPRVSDEQRRRCIEEHIKPYNTPAWQQWLEETKVGKAAAMPEVNWD
jgi:DNA-binding NarL/FixJ family response regulator